MSQIPPPQVKMKWEDSESLTQEIIATFGGGGILVSSCDKLVDSEMGSLPNETY